ncbi:Alpha/Beta hydrolase protein [Geopyxis carbonaria]|nr:Alpha/Beta hydrolase protein [Geopyxis carbonaria]
MVYNMPLWCLLLIPTYFGPNTYSLPKYQISNTMASPDLPTAYPEPLVVPPSAPHTHTLIMLHGLADHSAAFSRGLLSTQIFPPDAATNPNFSSLPTLRELLPGVKFVFPGASRRAMTLVSSMRLNGWFDLASLRDTAERPELQVAGLRESTAHIRALVAAEVGAGVPPQRVFVGGLSQGCAAALHVVLGSEVALGGCVGLSGWLPFAHVLEEVLKPGTEAGDDDGPAQALRFVRRNLGLEPAPALCLETPVFFGHGVDDEKVAVGQGEKAAEVVRKMGMDVTWKAYEGLKHWYNDGELWDMAAWMKERMQSNAR